MFEVTWVIKITRTNILIFLIFLLYKDFLLNCYMKMFFDVGIERGVISYNITLYIHVQFLNHGGFRRLVSHMGNMVYILIIPLIIIG